MTKQTRREGRRYVQLHTVKDGVHYVAMPIDGVAFRCGKCMRGVLLENQKRCRVCRNKVLTGIDEPALRVINGAKP